MLKTHYHEKIQKSHLKAEIKTLKIFRNAKNVYNKIITMKTIVIAFYEDESNSIPTFPLLVDVFQNEMMAKC